MLILALAATEATPEILSDEQIEQLLLEAEERLRSKQNLELISSDRNSSQLRAQIPKLRHGLDKSVYLREHNGIAQIQPEHLVPAEQKKMADELRPVDPISVSKKANDITSAGPDWFDIPKTDVTPQLKRDLQLIEMRNILDPHRHYKKNTRKGKIPTFSQTGTVIEGPTEFYSSRINRKDRSKNFVDEAMRGEQETGRFKRKYNEIQDAKTSGKKGHYKKLMAKRNKAG